jgi:CBS domain-containing membrane protein
VPRTVSDIMTRRVQSALPETMIAKLVPPMADMGLHHMPVVDHDNHVVGIITQSDLIAALFQNGRTGMATFASGYAEAG